MNLVLETIKNRRSVRKYKEEQIKEDELQLILEAGMYAPSACNQQPWHFTVIQNKELIAQMSDKAKNLMKTYTDEWIVNLGNNEHFDLHYGAPTVIVISGKKDCYEPITDSSAAIQNMLLAAESLGIGSCWIGLSKFYFMQEEASKLNIPDGYEPYFTISLGYKEMKEKLNGPVRNKDVVNYIR